MDEITNSADILDSRGIITRIDELESERTDLAAAVEAAEEEEEKDAEEIAKCKAALAEWDEDNGAELKALQELAEEAEGYCDDWKYGATLIRESYFKEYAQQLADDLHGNAVRNAEWPFNCIDWEQAARELQTDYTAVEFDGVTYLVR